VKPRKDQIDHSKKKRQTAALRPRVGLVAAVRKSKTAPRKMNRQTLRRHFSLSPLLEAENQNDGTSGVRGDVGKKGYQSPPAHETFGKSLGRTQSLSAEKPNNGKKKKVNV